MVVSMLCLKRGDMKVVAILAMDRVIDSSFGKRLVSLDSNSVLREGFRSVPNLLGARLVGTIENLNTPLDRIRALTFFV